MRQERNVPPPGEVTLIGCGPGDPELLTVKAVRRIAEADVLVADRLIGEGIFAFARPGARLIEVGKKPGGPSMAQHEINQILVREALLGHRVARLKGGDGFVFGRAAEEMAAVRTAGIKVDVIPGITAAHGCAASIALPLTLREHVRQFSILTGATAAGVPDLDWPSLARPGQAFAIYMGVGSAAHIERKLLDAGADGATPVVIVEKGSLPEERSIATTLDQLASAIEECRIKGPATIFVGLSWQEANLSPPLKVEFHAGRPKVLGLRKADAASDVAASLATSRRPE